ncbi:valine--tRNA ligase [Falsirhodobacter halotolerans]|uniref:valine--tRNA ligase n=1 Tax=Falsirhodobacter halotolerans TaxID=1146892 RepID=UPI001FCFCF9E|nr:valine--tRNA ligase [Falsirhodobacter halotolerans]MCJ8139754.1 valine--tRNA ligase [Falsirhodobacter halotolerans]
MPMEKTFNAAQSEARIAAMWEEMGAFRAGANAQRDETFCIMIPPPNVTGSLHMGHAFNNTLQDILVRWHRMRGFDTLWQPGTDHAGIATQMVVERQLAQSGLPTRRDMGREAFLDKVWEWKDKSGGTIVGQLKRLGASCDWDREAFTMSGNFPEAVTKVFVEMYRKGLIYRGKRLVNWDPHFETAISDLEVENVEVAGHMWHFKYRLADGATYDYVEKDEDGNVTLRETRDYISIATTRPETMLGDGAVAVHPSDERYAPIVGKMVHLPLCDRLIPIITDEYPDKNFGSGAVKITGAHDFNDYQVAKRANLPMYRLMDTRGHMRDDGAPYDEAVARARDIAAGSPTNETEVDALNLVPAKYRGMDRFEARKAVVADITAAGLAVTELVKSIDEETVSEHLTRVPVVENKPIMQPFGDRSKVVIEPMLTDQWFVATDRIVGPALDAVRNGDTQILPERDAKVYFHWLENIEPWCISRQLWWGHQIPVWYGPRKVPQSEEGTAPFDWSETMAFCAATEDEARAQMRDYYGEYALVPAASREAAMGDGAEQAPDVNAVSYWRDPDVLDTWFSSGLWPIGTLGWPEQTPELQKYFPTNVLVTGFDIIFFWVARMMMMQLAVVDQVPFKTVYVHALVRDEKGKKMSKSLGNVLDPLELIDEYGADAVRFTVTAMAAMGRDLKLSTARIAGYRNFGTKLWNACRFAEMNGVWDGHATRAKPEATATVNRWIIAETSAVLAEVNAALEGYRFDQAANALYAFVWGKVCDWYVEFAKPLFDGEHAAETRATMAWVLDQSMILLHPIMPFITEELWSTTGTRAKPLVHTDWPEIDATDAEATREMTWVISVIEGIRSARAQVRVPVGMKLDAQAIGMDATARAAWDRNAALIQRLARVETLTEAEAIPPAAITVAVEGATFAIPLEGVIDIAAEKARLEKTLQKLEKDMGGLKGRLNNPKFIASAPPEVIEESRELLAGQEGEAAKLSTALRQLG